MARRAPRLKSTERQLRLPLPVTSACPSRPLCLPFWWWSCPTLISCRSRRTQESIAERPTASFRLVSTPTCMPWLLHLVELLPHHRSIHQSVCSRLPASRLPALAWTDGQASRIAHRGVRARSRLVLLCVHAFVPSPSTLFAVAFAPLARRPIPGVPVLISSGSANSSLHER